MDRVLYRDIVPYEAPMSLTKLRGPTHGVLELPITVQWGPIRLFDLSDTGQRRMAYRALVRDGTPEVQEALLNRTVLLEEWPQLILPRRCQTLWEQRFPELTMA